MTNKYLQKAKNKKNDEFYTQYETIEGEMSVYLAHNPDLFRDKVILCPCDNPEWSNFTKYFTDNQEILGIKKVISSYYDPVTHEGNDFRSDEVTKLRDEADIIVTNPPFSLFREFVAWIRDAKKPKQFSVIGNMNAVGYKDVFPLIMNNELWLGPSGKNGVYFRVSKDFTYTLWYKFKREINGVPVCRLCNVRWFTNIDHGQHNQTLNLMTEADNIEFSKHKEVRGVGYRKYDNYNAIEVPFTDAIPSDHKGVMGVPISFLDKYNPDQFEILGVTQGGCHDAVPDTKKYNTYWEVRPNGTKTGSSGGKINEHPNLEGNDGKKNYFTNEAGHVIQSAYQRIFIKHRSAAE